MVFDSSEPARRRSSLVEEQKSSRPKRPGSSRQRTSCFVHTLLQEKRHDGAYTPSDEGMKAQKTADKDTGTPPNTDRHTQSRLLTKKQLSDMAFGIRELSKKLGHIRLKLNVRHVFILTKAHDEELISYTRNVTEWLLGQGQQTYTV